MHPEVKALIEHYNLERLPVEGTLFTSTYRSALNMPDGGPVGTAVIGLYCDDPRSVSCFHKLAYDEIWHFYAGDPLRLVLLQPDGSSEEVLMGSDPLAGHHVQFRVPAHAWQAGQVVPGGTYSLFGNTMAPGFTGRIFEAASAENLLVKWPDRAEDIKRLSVEGEALRMPDGYAP
jgi:predicted cupin superfamily sugar epimerase